MGVGLAFVGAGVGGGVGGFKAERTQQKGVEYVITHDE